MYEGEPSRPPLPFVSELEPEAIDVHTIAASCVGLRARVINRAVTTIYQEELRAWGVTISQVNLLVAIATHGPLGPRHLVGPMQMEKSTLSRNLDRMRANGWLVVEAEQGPPGRSQRVSISDEGRELLELLLPAWRRAQVRVEALLGPALIAALDGVANRLKAP
ncbi:MAG: MarR family winged helix-turn-helix transcriptional regulator [Myxococcota bacterium]